MTELGKQVWKKMEEMGWENAPEDFHLEYYENIIECTKQALTIPTVIKSVCDCDKPKPMARNLDETITCITCRKVIEQTVL